MIFSMSSIPSCRNAAWSAVNAPCDGPPTDDGPNDDGAPMDSDSNLSIIPTDSLSSTDFVLGLTDLAAIV